MPTKSYYEEKARSADARADNYESKGLPERAEYMRKRAAELRAVAEDAPAD